VWEGNQKGNSRDEKLKERVQFFLKIKGAFRERKTVARHCRTFGKESRDWGKGNRTGVGRERFKVTGIEHQPDPKAQILMCSLEERTGVLVCKERERLGTRRIRNQGEKEKPGGLPFKTGGG